MYGHSEEEASVYFRLNDSSLPEHASFAIFQKERCAFVHRWEKESGLKAKAQFNINAELIGLLWQEVLQFHGTVNDNSVMKMSIRIISIPSAGATGEHVDLGLYGVRLLTVYLKGESTYTLKVRGTSAATSWSAELSPGQAYALHPKTVRNCTHYAVPGPNTSNRLIAVMGYALRDDFEFIRCFEQQKMSWGRMCHWKFYYGSIVPEPQKERSRVPKLGGPFWE